MSRASSFFFARFATFTFGALAIAACGGDAFDLGAPPLDGAVDTLNPPRDGSSGGGPGGRDGSGAGGGTGGSAGSGGTAGSGAAGSDAAVDRAGDDARSDATARPDGSGDADVASDGHVRPDTTAIDGDAGSASDVMFDVPGNDVSTGIDAPITNDARDAGGNDLSMTPDTNDAAIADIVCTEPIVYYKDEDGDGFGVDGMTTSSCTPLSGKWSAEGGDCRDDLATVRPYKQGMPNPPAYSGVGYPANNLPQGVSFDYDCSGTEEADPTNAYGAEPECGGPLSCSGVGYIAANPSRQGPGIDPRCGSTTLKRCQLLLMANGPALCSSALETTQIPYRCR